MEVGYILCSLNFLFIRSEVYVFIYVNYIDHFFFLRGSGIGNKRSRFKLCFYHLLCDHKFNCLGVHVYVKVVITILTSKCLCKD